MRCKPDQICRITKSEHPDNINRLTRTIALIQGDEWGCEALQPIYVNSRTEDWFLMPAGETHRHNDYAMEPLHGGDGVDEMVKRVGKPKPIETTQPKERTYG